LPASGTLLILPQPPVLTLHLQSIDENDILVRLHNASDDRQSAPLGSALLTIAAAQQCDLFGQPQSALSVTQGSVWVDLTPRQTLTLRCRLA
jgi:hypothetical protein